jgi:hypothetical protein
MNSLLISDHKGQGLLRNEAGEPVWPISSDQQEKQLRLLAELFCCQVQRVTAIEKTSELVGPEEVCCLGEECRPAARLYAHLTGRRLRLVSTEAEIFDGPLPAVMVMRRSDVSYSLLQYLSASQGKTATGIICADTPEELWLRALLCSAATTLSSQPRIIRLDLCPLLPLEKETGPTWQIMGANAKVTELRSALKAGVGIVSLFTHSDGLDASLGPDLTLCPMNQRPITADVEKTPRCQVTGTCYRWDKPVAEVLESGELLPPEDISARILIWNSCQGFMLQEGRDDSAWGIAPRFLRSPTIGAVIFTSGIILLDKLKMNPLSEYLEQGISVGEALARFLNLPTSRRFGYEMCLFGDPRVRACLAPTPKRFEAATIEEVKTEVPVPVASISQKHEAADNYSDELAETGLLRACLIKNIRQGQQNSSAAVALRALNALGVYEYATWEGALSKGADEMRNLLGAEMRQAFLEYLFERRALHEDWGDFCDWKRVIQLERQCTECGLPLKAFVAEFRIFGVSDRWVLACPSCQIVGDVPCDSDLTLAVEGGGRLHLEGNLPERNWTGGVLINSWGVEAATEWPANQDGSPVRIFEPPCTLPPRHVDVTVFMLWNGTVVRLIARTRGAGKLAAFLAVARNPLDGPTVPSGVTG